LDLPWRGPRRNGEQRDKDGIKGTEHPDQNDRDCILLRSTVCSALIRLYPCITVTLFGYSFHDFALVQRIGDSGYELEAVVIKSNGGIVEVVVEYVHAKAEAMVDRKGQACSSDG
jgi:hypothetical protein